MLGAIKTVGNSAETSKCIYSRVAYATRRIPDQSFRMPLWKPHARQPTSSARACHKIRADSITAGSRA